MVRVPLEFNIEQNIEYVLDEVRRKYGFRTIALRHLARFSDYQCIELEMLGTDSRRLQAVWVGLDDYREIRGPGHGDFDPLRAWLEDKTRGVASLQRQPWEQPGWFRKATHWIDFQLDRLNIQGTGPAVQPRALMPGGAVLRVPTAAGKLYFLASRNRAPRQVPLTRFLSERWPERVTRVLADDAVRNWMLVPDFESQGQPARSSADLATAADAMAMIQLESAPLAPRLRDLGCHAVGLAQLQEFLGRNDLLEDATGPGRQGLAEAEREEFSQLLPRLLGLCEQLSGYALPAMLVHPDFRAANVVLRDQSVRVANWANSAVGHPFVSLLQLLHADHPAGLEAPDSDPVVRAYLARFEEFQTRERLLQALKLARPLHHAWTLMQWSREIPLLEAGGVSLAAAQQTWAAVARQLLEANRAGAQRFLAK